MRDKAVKAREKTTHKMTRDGLVERGGVSGEERRVSMRMADFSLDKTKPTQQTGRPSTPSTGKQKQQKRHRTDPIDREASGDLGGVSQEETIAELQNRPSDEVRPIRAAPTDRPGRKKSRRSEKSPMGQKPVEHGVKTGDGRLQFRRGEATADVPSAKAGKAQKQQPFQTGQEEIGRLHFEKQEDATDTAPTDRGRKKPAQQKLQFDRSEQTAEERTAAAKASAQEKQAAAEPSEQTSEDGSSAHRRKKVEKAERKLHQKEKQLEQAKRRLPMQRRLHYRRKFDPESGTTKRKFHFETEVKPEKARHPLKTAAKSAAYAPYHALLQKGHQKIHQVEKDNVGVEAAHKGEEKAEVLARQARWYLKQHQKHKPYRTVRKLERQVHRANINYLYQRALLDHPELEHKKLQAWVQKQKIKRQYAKAARQAEHTAHSVKEVFVQIIRAIAHFCGAHKTVIGIVAVGMLLMVMLSSMLASCGAMLSGAATSSFAASYTADDVDITSSDLYYSQMETDLEYEIDHIEETHPGYDEYRYNVGEIGHSAYELMAYLSAMYDFFTFAEIQTVLDDLYAQQYDLQLIPEVEIRTDGDGDTYEWHILNVILTVTPMTDIILPELEANGLTYKYEVYQQTYGNRQNYGNPFSFSWLSYVSSPYGYRIHPITGEKDLHRGIDIAVSSGTPILAIHDGRVISAGDAGGYGLCVVIEDERGYQSRYAHCSRLDVSAGQEVKKGDIIAAVGSTGNSTGSHLHLEVLHNGEYLNPYYFVDNGDDGSGAIPGSPGGIVIPPNPGTPMGDGSYDALIAEAEQYLGYPYVWGGSSPSTSFDCSGFVCWVYTHSGVYDLPRTTAQGIFNQCTPVSRENAKPGDLIFFTGTYSTPNPVSHIGIYVGNGQMIHAGDPISYANINSNYWTNHFYSFGRLPSN